MSIINIKGGLGNQMYQYSLGIFLKEKCNFFVEYDIESLRCNKLRSYELDNVFGIDINEAGLKTLFMYKGVSVNLFGKCVDLMTMYKKIVKKRPIFSWYVTEEKFNKLMSDGKKCMRGGYFDGYFQRWDYLSEIRRQLLDIFIFPEIASRRNVEIAKEIKMTNSVSVHIRRTDYLKDPLLGGIVGRQYYEKAIDIISKKENDLVFFVFSDDIKWAKENIDFKGRKVRFINWNIGRKSFRDMQLMTLCKHNIIANSSFSWWGAWLGNRSGKVVISPGRWLNDPNDLIDKRIPKEWIKIGN